MLSDEEKMEMLKDAYNPERKINIAKCRDINFPSSRSLDEYIKFLTGIQKVFGPFKISREKSVTGKNKI
jgi:hypothetical protein